MGRLLIPAGLEEKEQRHEVQREKARGHSHRVFAEQREEREIGQIT